MVAPVLALLALLALTAAGPTDEPVPDDAFLESSGAVIGDVQIEAQDIFDPNDPKEDAWIYRAANAAHRVTRPRIIRNLLLFKPGDPYVAARLRESERLLRAQRYLFDATIVPTRYADGKVDVRVKTRDVWTLTVGVGFARKGGKSTTRFGVEDSNFLGTGKEFTLRRLNGIDRDEDLVRYRDPAVAGSRVEIDLTYSDNSDGRRQALSLRRPFFSLDTRWTIALDAVDDDRVVSLYERGDVIDEFRQTRHFAELESGLALARRTRRAHRFRAGLTWETVRFFPVEAAAPPLSLPEDRRLAYPWVGYDTAEDGFEEAHDLDRIARTEDLNLAPEGRVRVGVSAPFFGGDRSRLLYVASWRAGWKPTPGQLLFAEASAEGRLAEGADENKIVSAALRWYLRNFGRHVFYVSVRGSAAWRLDGEDQLLLGGDNGLRGYPLRYVGGDRSWLFTVEQRFYTDWHLWRLVHVGGAIFADVGRAWTAGSAENELGTLRDVGFGLRLGSSRSAQGSMLHIDWAFALDGDASIRRSQILFTSRERF